MLFIILIIATELCICARLAQSVEHETLTLGRGFEPHVGRWLIFVTCFNALSVCSTALH